MPTRQRPSCARIYEILNPLSAEVLALMSFLAKAHTVQARPPEILQQGLHGKLRGLNQEQPPGTTDDRIHVCQLPLMGLVTERSPSCCAAANRHSNICIYGRSITSVTRVAMIIQS